MLEDELHARLLQAALDAEVDGLCAFGAQMADGAVHELEARLDGTAANGRDLIGVADALHVLVRAEVKVDLVAARDGGLHEVRAYELGQVAAHVAGERELPVGERASTREPRGDAAGLAVHAHARLRLGAAAALDGKAAVHEHDMARVAPAEQAERCEDARGTRTYDEHVGRARDGCHDAPPQRVGSPFIMPRSAVRQAPEARTEPCPA